jgi:hypothetical protein
MGVDVGMGVDVEGAAAEGVGLEAVMGLGALSVVAVAAVRSLCCAFACTCLLELVYLCRPAI